MLSWGKGQAYFLALLFVLAKFERNLLKYNIGHLNHKKCNLKCYDHSYYKAQIFTKETFIKFKKIQTTRNIRKTSYDHSYRQDVFTIMTTQYAQV